MPRKKRAVRETSKRKIVAGRRIPKKKISINKKSQRGKKATVIIGALVLIALIYSLGSKFNIVPSITGFVVKNFGDDGLSEEERIYQKLVDAGCSYDIKTKSRCMKFENPYYVVKAEGCYGTCRYNSLTREIEIEEPECNIPMLPNECSNDSDCRNKITMCASKYICFEGMCIPDNLLS